jgi:hypothetical protein
VSTPTATKHPPSMRDSALYWFASLEKAIEDGDVVASAEAHRELARLGVEVTYRPQLMPLPAGEVSCAH